MKTEQQFVDLIKAGKVSDAMQSIKEALTTMAGKAVVEQKFAIAEQYGLKKLKEEEEEDFEDDDESEESDDDKDDDKKDK